MIFVANTLAVNGGTTFLLRITKELQSQGRKSAVICLTSQANKKLQDELSKTTEIYFLPNFIPPLFRKIAGSQLSIFMPLLWRKLISIAKEHGNQLHVMGLFGLVFGARFKSIHPDIAISAGVYHQNEFLFKYNKNLFLRSAEKIFLSLSSQNIVFFNEYCQWRYGTFFNKDFNLSSVVPIGINIKPIARPTVDPGRHFILVGNLETFKTYNEHMVQIVSELKSKFPDIRCDIYGEGVEKTRIANLIKQLGVESHVFLKGSIPYSEFEKVVSSALLFVGSGTAILEASLLGVPSLIGIESISKPQSYGYLYQIDGLTYNEMMANKKLINMKDVVQEICETPEIRNEIGLKCHQKALEFSIEKTGDGFARLEKVMTKEVAAISVGLNIKMFFSFGILAIKDLLGIDRGFRNRRDQSS